MPRTNERGIWVVRVSVVANLIAWAFRFLGFRAMTEHPTKESGKPLNLRLRGEAAEWDDGESVVPLLIEAAEMVETLAARVAELEWERRAISPKERGIPTGWFHEGRFLCLACAVAARADADTGHPIYAATDECAKCGVHPE